MCDDYHNPTKPTFTGKEVSAILFFKNVEEAILPPASDEDLCDMDGGNSCPCTQFEYEILWLDKETTAPEGSFSLDGDKMAGILSHTPDRTKRGVLSDAYDSLFSSNVPPSGSFTLVVAVRNKGVGKDGGSADNGDGADDTIKLNIVVSDSEFVEPDISDEMKK